MKAVVAALVLLFQLQPLWGTVACLGLSERAARQECRMPEHGQAPTTTLQGQVPTTTLTASGAAAQSCAMASICTPAPLAIPGLSTRVETAVPLLGDAGLLAATLPLGISPAPPFHPPRA